MSSTEWLEVVVVGAVVLAWGWARCREWGGMESGRIDCCGWWGWKVGGMGWCVGS